MTRIRDRTGDIILGRGLLSGTAIQRDLMQRILADLTRWGAPTQHIYNLSDLAAIIARFRPLMEQNLYETEVAAWIAGANEAVNRLPPAAQRIVGEFNGMTSGGGQPPFDVLDVLFPGDDGERIVRFPIIDQAAERLAGRNVVTRDQFDQLSASARANAFTVAYQGSEQAIAEIQQALTESINEGTSLKDFRRRMETVVLESPLSPSHLENVYRTNVQTALIDGHEELANNPIVSEIFPYQEYLAIHDARARDEHLALESMGLNKTNIYRRDDPMWELFLPPWGYQCRCGVNLLTLEDAAGRGVKEAQLWLRTGEPPARPEWRLNNIPFRPDPSWARRRPVHA